MQIHPPYSPHSPFLYLVPIPTGTHPSFKEWVILIKSFSCTRCFVVTTIPLIQSLVKWITVSSRNHYFLKVTVLKSFHCYPADFVCHQLHCAYIIKCFIANQIFCYRHMGSTNSWQFSIYLTTRLNLESSNKICIAF
jgi:hypothetical protein